VKGNNILDYGNVILSCSSGQRLYAPHDSLFIVSTCLSGETEDDRGSTIEGLIDISSLTLETQKYNRSYGQCWGSRLDPSSRPQPIIHKKDLGISRKEGQRHLLDRYLDKSQKVALLISVAGRVANR